MTRIKDIKNNKTYYITYDANKCGQPIKMWLKGKEQNLLWEDKNLIQIGEHIKYSYNTEGIRTKKETEEGTTEYSLIGSKIMKMEKVTSSGKITMYFTYDQRDELQSVTESNKEYYYIKDITGNIIKIKDEEGNSIVEYKYDAYGKVEKTIIENNNVSKYNPFIYKGYYYDEETELYYCNTRYYSPEIGRWISIDDVDYLDPESVSGLNLYCYCMNDPISYCDPSGNLPRIDVCLLEDMLINKIKKLLKGQTGNDGCEVNGILMNHYTTSLIENKTIGSLIGNVSYTVTTQSQNSKKFYLYDNIGNDGCSKGIGFNLSEWYGVNWYYSSDFGIGRSVQITPWLTFGSEISLVNGISFSAGNVFDNTTEEFTVNIGWGAILAIAAVPVIVSAAGISAFATAAACILLLIKSRN